MTKENFQEPDEITTRLRRIEKRLTKFMEWQGFDIQVVKPTWRDGRVNVASVATPLREILDVIPKDWDSTDDVEIYHRGKFVATLNKSEFITDDMENENAV